MLTAYLIIILSYAVLCVSNSYQYWTVALHYYSMGLVAKDVCENQEVELFLFLFTGYLEATWLENENVHVHCVL